MKLDQFIEPVKAEILKNEGVVSVEIHEIQKCDGYGIEVYYEGAGTLRLNYFTYIDLINFELKKVLGFAHCSNFECVRKTTQNI